MKNNKGKKLVTIVMITFNALDFIKACVNSIKKYTHDDIYDLLIVDNHSDQKTIKYLKSLKNKRNIRVIFNEKNVGYGEANNQAMKYVTTKYTCLLNSDIVVSPLWLDNLIKPLEEKDDIAITIPVSNCTSAIDFETKEELFPRWEVFKKYFSNLSIDKSLEKFYKGYESYTEKYYKQKSEYKNLNFPGWAGTWCVVFKTKILDEIGGLFDEQFKIGYCEDVDFCWRVYQKEYKIVEVQNSFVHHYSNASFDMSDFDKHQLGRDNKIKLMKKYEKMLEDYIEKITHGDKYELAFLSYEQSMVKSFVKYRVMKKKGKI